MTYPSNWKKVKFGEIAKRKSIRIDNPKESNYDRYVGLEHLDSGELIVKRWGSTKDVSSSMQVFQRNDILFARRNTYLKRVSVALFDGVCSGDIIVIEPILTHMVEGFLPIYMQYSDFENKAIAWSAGAFSKRIKWSQLSDFDVWLPSKEEQQQIVNLIWSIQKNQENVERLIHISEKLKRSFLKELLSKGMHNKKLKDSEIGKLPIDWDVKTLEECCFAVVDCPHSTPKFTEEGVLIIRNFNINDGELLLQPIYYTSENEWKNRTKRCIPKNNDVLFSREAPIGEACLAPKDVKFSLGQRTMLFRPNNKVLNSTFLVQVFYSPIIKDKLKNLEVGVTAHHVNVKDIRKLMIPLPPIDEQRKIVDTLNSTYDFMNKARNNLSELSTLRKRLTDSYLSGELPIHKEVGYNVQ